MKLALPSNNVTREHMFIYGHVGTRVGAHIFMATPTDTHEACRETWHTLRTEGSGLSRCCQRERIRSVADLSSPVGTHVLISGFRIDIKFWMTSLYSSWAGLNITTYFDVFIRKSGASVISSSSLLARLL